MEDRKSGAAHKNSPNFQKGKRRRVRSLFQKPRNGLMKSLGNKEPDMLNRSLAFLVLCALSPADAQVNVRWDANPSKRSIGCPSSGKGGSLVVRVSNLNNIVYAHAIDTSVVATPVYPPAPIALTSVRAAVLSAADLSVNRLLAIYKPGFVPSLLASGHYANLPVDATLRAWALVEASPDWARLDKTETDVLAFGSGDAAEMELREAILFNIAKLREAGKAVAAATGNSLSSTVQIDWAAKNVVKVRVTQTFGLAPVQDGEQEFTCTIDSGAFTLSLGPVFSKIQARKYVSQAVPSGTTSTNIMAVENGSGYRAAGATLVNFALPGLSHKAGWALFLTTGPIVKSTVDSTSAFGWFVGTSVGLNRLLYLTPGFHYGEFSDFPPGYAAGTPIPAGAGTPSPLKRWTWRFAFGISFRTASFSKSEDKPAASAQQPAAAKADKQTGAPPSAAGGGGTPGVGLPASSGASNPANQ